MRAIIIDQMLDVKLNRTSVSCNRSGDGVKFYRTMPKRDTTTEDTEKMWRRFGRWIEEQRRHTDLSQEAAAEKSSMQRGNWIRIAQGESTKRDTVIRMARAVNADVDLALEKAGFSMPILSGDRPSKITRHRFDALHYKVQKLTPEQRKKFAVVMEFVEQNIDSMLAGQDGDETPPHST